MEAILLAEQGENSMLEPWNTELYHMIFLCKKEIWFFVTALIYCRPCLKSGIEAVFDELPPWTFPLINAGTAAAWKNSFSEDPPAHRKPSKLSFKMGLSFICLSFGTCPLDKIMATSYWPFENWNVTTARGKVKSRNRSFCKIVRHHGMKMGRKKKANMKQEDRNHISSQWGNKQKVAFIFLGK